MLKTMTAKYRGRCSITGAAINPGDDIVFDTVSRKAWFSEPGDCQVEAAAGPYLAARKSNYVSDVYSVAGREYTGINRDCALMHRAAAVAPVNPIA